MADTVNKVLDGKSWTEVGTGTGIISNPKPNEGFYVAQADTIPTIAFGHPVGPGQSMNFKLTSSKLYAKALTGSALCVVTEE